MPEHIRDQIAVMAALAAEAEVQEYSYPPKPLANLMPISGSHTPASVQRTST